MLDSSNPIHNPVTNEESSLGASGVDSPLSKSVPQEPNSAINTISDSQSKPFEQLSGKMPDIALTASTLNQSDQFIRLVDDINILVR